MPAKRRDKGERIGRYDVTEITSRVERLRKARGVEVKTICEAIGLERWDWSRKVRQDRSTFSINELGLIADFLEAPIGWPFLSEETSRLIERMLPGGK